MDMDLRRIRSTFSERDAYTVLPGLPQEVPSMRVSRLGWSSGNPDIVIGW